MDEKFYNEIREVAMKITKQIRAIEKDSGNYENPVDADLILSTKATTYEYVIEILKKYKKVE